MSDPDVLIVGAGHNGLVAAATLARAGLRVTLLERHHTPGGGCVTEELFPGHHVSTAADACHLLQDPVVEDLQLRQHGFEILPLDPWMALPVAPNQHLLLWRDEQRTQAELARFSHADAEAYPKWNAFWRTAASLIQPWLLNPPPTLNDLRRSLAAPDQSFLATLLELSMSEVVYHFFQSEPARAAFIHAHDCGTPDTPGSAWTHAYYECNRFCRPENQGLVRGGMGNLTRALLLSAQSAGAMLHTHSHVGRILTENNRATGVQLANGSILHARIILSNADPKTTLLQLLPNSALPEPFVNRTRNLHTRATTLRFHARLDHPPDFSRFFHSTGSGINPQSIVRWRLCPSVEAFQTAAAEARQGTLPQTPILEVQVPTALDPSLAPPGQHHLSVRMLHAPVTPGTGTWDDLRQTVTHQIIERLAAHIPNFEGALRETHLLTPPDLQTRFGMTDGHPNHIDLIPSQMLARRPLIGWAHHRTPIEGLYLCGAGTHPGGEITGAPGYNAARAVLDDLRA